MTVVLTISALMGASCSGKTGSNIIGKWTPVKGQNVSSFSSFAFSSVTSLEFLKDGTYIAGIMGGSGSGNYSFPDANHIKFQSPTGSNTYTFSLSENTLALIEPNGDLYKFYREDTVPNTVNTATTLKTFEQILSTIPDTPDTRQEVDINNYAQFRTTFNVKAPKVNASVDEQTQYIYGISGTDNMLEALIPNPIAGIFNNTNYLQSSIEAMQNLGLGYWSIDQEASTGTPPATYHIIKGQFSLETTRQALAVSAKNDPPVTSTYDGNTVFSWGGDNQINVSKSLKPPAYDQYGRGGRYVVQNDYVFRTNATSEMTAILDTQKGKQSSLYDVTEFKLMAQELSTQGALCALMTNKTQSVDYVRTKLTMSGKISNQDLNKYLTQSPKLLTYQTMSVGLGKDDKGVYAFVILINPDAQTAANNVSLLQQRINETSPTTGNPWTSYFTSSSITSHDRVLTAKFYGSKGSWWFSWYNIADPLALCQ